MAESAERARLAQLESLGDPLQFAGRIHSLITFSPLFENFNLTEIRLLSQFMQVYRAGPGVEIIREGDPGDFMGLLIEGRIEVFKQDRWNAPRLIALIAPGQSFGEMSMIDGEPRFASCIAAESCMIAVLSRDSLARIILEQTSISTSSMRIFAYAVAAAASDQFQAACLHGSRKDMIRGSYRPKNLWHNTWPERWRVK